ncbi:MAG: sporulation membrane protein YtaF [Firmicutes bacterium]|nr:sporulation membrane protein YtaF [Bacillota bacterium]
MAFSVLLLALSLSLDALGVGLVYGLRKIKIPFPAKLTICLFSILYSGLALALGSSLARAIEPFYAKLTGTIILILMGAWIIIQNLNGNGKKIAAASEDESLAIPHPADQTLLKIVIKSLGITIHVVRNPIEIDINHSGIIDFGESLLLGLALSVDAIGAGIGSGLAGFSPFWLPLVIGLFQMGFLFTGGYLGKKCVPVLDCNSKVLSILPGVILIIVALIRIC